MVSSTLNTKHEKGVTLSDDQATFPGIPQKGDLFTPFFILQPSFMPGWSPLIHRIVFSAFDAEELRSHLEYLETPSQHGSSPLFFAVVMKDEETLLWLLQQGCCIHVRNHYGETPLHWAAQAGLASIVKTLLASGADIKSRDNDGFTPLDWSNEQNHPNLARLLQTKSSLSTCLIM